MKNGKKLIICLLAAILFVSTCIDPFQTGEVEVAKAATRLSGVQKIVDSITEEKPFVILELVPDHAYASMGYYVQGEEPELDEELVTGYMISHAAGHMTKAARQERVKELLEKVAVDQEIGIAASYPASYLYEEWIPTENDDTDGWFVIRFEPTENEGVISYHTETRTGRYEFVGVGLGDYSVEEEDESESAETTTTSVAETTTTSAAETTTESAAETTTVAPVDPVVESSAETTTVAPVEPVVESSEETTTESAADPVVESSEETTTVAPVEPVVESSEETTTESAADPVVESSEETTTETTTEAVVEPIAESEEETTAEQESEPELEQETTAEQETEPETEDNNTYVYTPGEGDYRWVDVAGGKEYQVSFQTLCYRVNITSNDWFAKHVFEYSADATSDGKIRVITVTPSELEANIQRGYLAKLEDGKVLSGWSDVDCLYISNTAAVALDKVDASLRNELESYDAVDENGAYTNDISGSTGYIIYEYVFNTSFPVIVDAGMMSPSVMTAAADAVDAMEAGTNLQKLAYLLWDYTEGMEPNSYNVPLNTWTTMWPAGLSVELCNRIQGKAFGQYGSVQGSVYFNYDHELVHKDSDSGDMGFAVPFTNVSVTNESESVKYDETALRGLSSVINEIVSENFHNKDNGLDTTKEYHDNNGAVTVDVAMSTVVKYILNYANRRQVLYKDAIRILDIEPTRYSTLTEKVVRSWLKDVDSQRIQKIEIMHMTTHEFIGVLSDLTAEYDLIYFGDCIGPERTHGAMNQTVTYNSTTGEYEKSTIYNDTDMNGLIYSHVGDSFMALERNKGMITTEITKNSSGQSVLVDGTLKTRFSGNDITKDKLAELKAYVNTGYPVVISDTFYGMDDKGDTMVNSKYVDSTSYLYEFFNYCIVEENMKHVMPDTIQSSSLLATYLNMSRLQLAMISKPVEYAVTYDDAGILDKVTFLPERNGKYVLEYEFELSNLSGNETDATTYRVELFVDTNADGRYAETEELDGLTVYNVETGRQVEVDQLTTGVRYAMSRALPEGFVGMIPWKLQLTQNDAEGVRTSEVGYTAVKAKNKTNIKVLLIQPNSKSNAMLIDQHPTFTQLFANVEDKLDYHIEFTTMTSKSYAEHYKNKGGKDTSGWEKYYNDHLKQYDMVIIGFTDCFSEIASKGAVMALKVFIEEGKSVLFSHDTTSFINVDYDTLNRSYGNSGPTHWGYNLNTYIRSMVGMDRYGVTEDTLSFLRKGEDLTVSANGSDLEKIAGLHKDIAYKANNSSTTYYEVHGLNDSHISAMVDPVGTKDSDDMRDDGLLYGQLPFVYIDLPYEIYSSSYNATKHPYKYGLSSNDPGGSPNVWDGDDYLYGDGTYCVSQVNKGQITTFPYDINVSDDPADRVAKDTITENGVEYLQVNLPRMVMQKTHAQYYQLDMNMDVTGDDIGDIVVWYCLTDGLYDAVPNNVRNDYYIYSVGNIMYTGIGHRKSNVDVQEAKLLINTIIASYSSGRRDPNVYIVEKDNKAVIKEYSYRNYDPDAVMSDGVHEDIYFYVSDNNVVNGVKEIQLAYYVEVDAATYNSLASANRKSVIINGSTVYLRKLPVGAVDAASEVATNKSKVAITEAPATIANNAIGKLTVNGEWLENYYKLEKTSNNVTTKTKTEVTIYVGAKTLIKDANGTLKDETNEVYTKLTIKVRDLFDLD